MASLQNVMTMQGLRASISNRLHSVQESLPRSPAHILQLIYLRRAQGKYVLQYSMVENILACGSSVVLSFLFLRRALPFRRSTHSCSLVPACKRAPVLMTMPLVLSLLLLFLFIFLAVRSAVLGYWLTYDWSNSADRRGGSATICCTRTDLSPVEL